MADKEDVLGGFYIYKNKTNDSLFTNMSTLDKKLITGIVIFQRVKRLDKKGFKSVFFYYDLQDIDNLNADEYGAIPEISDIKKTIVNAENVYDYTAQNLVEFSSKCFAPPLTLPGVTDIRGDDKFNAEIHELMYMTSFDSSETDSVENSDESSSEEEVNEKGKMATQRIISGEVRRVIPQQKTDVKQRKTDDNRNNIYKQHGTNDSVSSRSGEISVSDRNDGQSI